MKGEHQFRIRDASQDHQAEVQSSLVRENVQRITGRTNNDCRFQILILTNSLHQQHGACWKIRFKTEVCTCSQFFTEAMLWIKEVELVDSVDDLKSSCSVRRKSNAKFSKYSMRGLLQHCTESSRIPASMKRSVWRNKKLTKKNVSFEEDKIAYLIYD